MARQQEPRAEEHRAVPIIQLTAYHVDQGAVTMYAVDANAAVQNHPDEWSFMPVAGPAGRASRQSQQTKELRNVSS
jgi:hypothetical protein